MLTLRQLRYFEHLARERHFGRAAEACAVTQPALSMQIRELEAVLGGRLVNRTREGVRLTELGEDVLSRSASILAAVRDLEVRARMGRSELSGPIKLGVIPSIAPYLLPRLLPEIRERHPLVQLSLRESQTAVLVKELLAGALDAVVMSLPIYDPDVETETLFDDAFLLAAAVGSATAQRSIATADLLDDDELLLLEDGHCFRDQALTVCRTIDPRRLKSFGATSLSTLLQLVANGQGITLLPRLFVDSEAREDPRVKLLRFADPEPKRTLALAFRRTSPAKAAFRALAETIRSAHADRPPAVGPSAPAPAAL
ncbi:MAG TPA: LysR substrate-binding domain-containing protein [Hansschlegelia sp.]